jgi:hypothetical protein
MIAFAAREPIACKQMSVIVFIFSLVWAGQVFADKVYLKSGDLMECIVVSEEPNSITVQMEGGYVQFKHSEIVNVERETDEGNRALSLRWRVSKKNRADLTKSKPQSCGKFFSVSPSASGQGRGAVSGSWFIDVQKRMEDQLMTFPPAAFILNLGPVAAYRRNNPTLYVLAFYSAILLILTPIVALMQNALITWWNARQRKRSKNKLSS